jgi:RNA polymerase sigma-70 factor, ECF subfamily
MSLNRAHFEQLAMEQLDLLYRVARRLTRNPDRAQDLVQETYLRALRARETFRLGDHGIRAWMIRIMHNVHFSRSQREKRQPHAMDGPHLDLLSGEADEVAAGMSSFDGMDERLVKALNELPEEYQTVLLLWAVEELSYKEIAEALSIPIGTVMSRLYRARHRLAEQLADLAPQERILRE